MPRLPFTTASMSEMETEIIVSHVLAPATIQSHGHLQCKRNLIRGCRRSAAVSSLSEPEGLRAGGDLAGPTTRPRPRGECKGWVWRHHSRSADYSDRVGGGQEAPGVGRRESGGRGALPTQMAFTAQLALATVLGRVSCLTELRLCQYKERARPKAALRYACFFGSECLSGR